LTLLPEKAPEKTSFEAAQLLWHNWHNWHNCRLNPR
jgi:hypothetical protein